MARLSFFICAHQDDWFYFRGEVAYSELHDNQSIIIFTTCGDGGCNDGWWQIREKAALAALTTAAPDAPILTEIVHVHGTDGNVHPIIRYRVGTTSSGLYCLRLPDGINKPNNLTNLMNGGIAQLEAVDHSTTYLSWNDLCMTLENIVRTEANESGTSTPWINAPFYISDEQTNPGDHPDHHATAFAVKQFASNFCNRAWWWSYAIAGHTEWQLNPTDLTNKQILFNAYHETVTNLVAANDSPQCSARWAGWLPDEWNEWGRFSHAILVEYPAPDPV